MVKSIPLTKADVLHLLSEIVDPEIPVVNIQEMGMLRDVLLSGDSCEVLLTPTYNGCPAMGIIEQDILLLLQQHGIPNAKVKLVYAPAWTTDWMSDSTKEKLKHYGIAAPLHSSCVNWLKPDQITVACPNCGSEETLLVSRFGSTACKALYRCNGCKEPFEYFKCH